MGNKWEAPLPPDPPPPEPCALEKPPPPKGDDGPLPEKDEEQA